MPTTRKMSDRHEEDLVAVLGGQRTRNSGAVWSDQMDGHQAGLDQHYKFAWDGKATLGKSIGVSREMWNKAVEQSRHLLTAIPLRFYADTRLTKVDIDLIALDLETFAEILADANKYRLIDEIGCIEGVHDHEPLESGSVPGMFVSNGACRGCGKFPYEASLIAGDEG